MSKWKRPFKGPENAGENLTKWVVLGGISFFFFAFLRFSFPVVVVVVLVCGKDLNARANVLR